MEDEFHGQCSTQVKTAIKSSELLAGFLALVAFLLVGAADVQSEPAGAASPVSASPQDRLAQARAFEANKQYDQAMAAYRQYLAAQPEDDEVRGALARVLSWQGEYDEAIALYKDILPRHPADLDVRVALARVKSWQKKFAEARQLYEGVLSEDAKNLEAQRGLADTLYWSGEYALALRLYEEMFAATPDPEIARRIKAVRSELTRVTSLRSLRTLADKEKLEPFLPYRNYFKIGYSHFTYTKNIPDEQDWLFEALAKPIGTQTIVARIEALDRFGLHDTLVSGELYSPLWEKAWGYVGAAVGINPEFVPKWTLGGEVFQSLGILHPALSFLEPSFGYRRMTFRATEIDLLTPGVTLYFPYNMWLTEKVYYVPDTNSKSLSSALTWRVIERLELFASGTFGTSGERISTPQDLTRTDTRVIQGGLTFRISQRFSAEAGGYYEERRRQYIRRGTTFALALHW
ncbi:MAG: YaiO family outer membrane beta-barrel protein [Deltaproteobacteria bacterium]|nr:YaiO family outer membrane beta-barrel protein [Deltaproteobacteria bacterium]